MIEDKWTERVLVAVADAADRAGGSFMQTLPDGRMITVVVVHQDAQPPHVEEGARA